MRKINIGTAYPLGSSETERGVNFSVAAPDAIELELLLFEEENDLLPEEWRSKVERMDETGRARMIADYISGMTDRFALQEHKRQFHVYE